MKPIRELLPGIYMFEKQNFYDEPVNTYLIHLKDKLLLIDIPDHTADNIRFISSFRKKGICYLTHGPTGTTEGNYLKNELGMEVFVHKADKLNKWLKIIDPTYLIGKQNIISDDIFIYHTPGHTMGSVVIHHRKENALFTGDTIHGGPDNEIDDFTVDSRNENIGLRIESCIFLSKLSFNCILPFHGTVILNNATVKLKNFINEKLKK